MHFHTHIYTKQNDIIRRIQSKKTYKALSPPTNFKYYLSIKLMNYIHLKEKRTLKDDTEGSLSAGLEDIGADQEGNSNF
jgi:hypothetical protein